MQRSSKCLKGFFYIEGKLKLQCLTILWKSRWVEGSLNLEILRGGGVKEFWKSRWEGGQKTVPSVVGVWIFSAITHWIEGWKKSYTGDANCQAIHHQYLTDTPPTVHQYIADTLLIICRTICQLIFDQQIRK